MYDGITQGWKPPIETEPEIKRHIVNLDLIWIGNATFTLPDAEARAMTSTDHEAFEILLVVDEQRERARRLKPVQEVQQLTEASATPL